MSMFCVMGDHEICEALGAQSIVHFSVDPDAPSMVPCNCPCHGCRHDGETYRTDYTNAPQGGDCWYQLEVSKPDGGWHVYLHPSHSYAHIRDEATAWDALNYFSDYYSDGPAKFRLVRCWEESEVIQ